MNGEVSRASYGRERRRRQIQKSSLKNEWSPASSVLVRFDDVREDSHE